MSNCKKCDAPIVWVKTPAGRHMPCDAGLADWPDGTVVDEAGNVHTSGGRGYRVHWASCPAADEFRRSKQRSLSDI